LCGYGAVVRRSRIFFLKVNLFADISGKVMIGIDADTDVLLENLKNIDRALYTGTAAQNRLRKVIRSVLSDVRVQIVAAAPLKRDPREARRAVRTSVYKAILGGNVNIYNSRKAHGRTSYVPARHPSHIGGNRRKRSFATARIMSYAGHDRGFILRWTNGGTQERAIDFHYDSSRASVNRGSRGGDVNKYGRTVNTGSRGSVPSTRWFERIASSRLQAASPKLAQLIEQEITKILANG
jgi:hypothetical protein